MVRILLFIVTILCTTWVVLSAHPIDRSIVSHEPFLIKRKGGGGGGRGGGGGGSRGGSKSGGGGAKGGSGGNGSRPSKSISKGSKPSSKGSTRNPNTASYSTFVVNPTRGFSPSSKSTTILGKAFGKTNKASSLPPPYTPPPSYYGGAKYASVNQGQHIRGYSIPSQGAAPSVYYRPELGSRWVPAVYYPVYPYPYWAYGHGDQYQGVYIQNEYKHGFKKCFSELRNITMVAPTNGDGAAGNGSNIGAPLYNNTDLFRNGKNVTVVSHNNGTVFIDPCGNNGGATMLIGGDFCKDIIQLDLVKGVVVRGNAKVVIQNNKQIGPGAVFELKYGNSTTTLRTETIANTKCKINGGLVTGVVAGCIFGALLVGLSVWMIWGCIKSKNNRLK
ncbi:hypothetical protein H4219_005844 [Mycoemilia scoparia]|uniref:Uncharacterized protein n=1 Tax=Mycoemilia scoparia TaxID=417184 RepID=A0A9W7ZRW0_9FUNG|nr:hypothetical protein H4219_005844 [Mycoemilia scoparia]